MTLWGRGKCRSVTIRQESPGPFRTVGLGVRWIKDAKQSWGCWEGPKDVPPSPMNSILLVEKGGGLVIVIYR